MIQVFIKEVNGFLNSLIAYMVMGVFLTSMGLLMWVFPETSVLDYGYADMDTLFSMSPYVFIFLIPAITMKSFAEEKKMGTLELLFTKPLSDLEIIIGKWLAAFALVIVALLPTLVYYFSVSSLGNPAGNVDTPGAMGFAPAATLRMPSWTSAWASTVAVVVPSPATSLVLVATLLASCAPRFSYGSSRSTSRAMVTPSLVIVGAPNFLSMTTLRPRGPSVTLTASASLSTPRSRERRASSLNLMILAMRGPLRG